MAEPDDKPSNWSATFYWIMADNCCPIWIMVLTGYFTWLFGPDEVLALLRSVGVWADDLPIQIGGLE